MITLEQFPVNQWESEYWRVGYDLYRKPPKNGIDDSWKYTLVPQRKRRFRKTIDGVGDQNLNTFPLEESQVQKFREKVSRHMTSRETVPYDLFEVLLPIIKRDRSLRKMGRKTDESIREYFLPIIYPEYPVGFFDQEKFRPNTLCVFFE